MLRLRRCRAVSRFALSRAFNNPSGCLFSMYDIYVGQSLLPARNRSLSSLRCAERRVTTKIYRIARKESTLAVPHMVSSLPAPPLALPPQTFLSTIGLKQLVVSHSINTGASGKATYSSGSALKGLFPGEGRALGTRQGSVAV